MHNANPFPFPKAKSLEEQTLVPLVMLPTRYWNLSMNETNVSGVFVALLWYFLRIGKSVCWCFAHLFFIHPSIAPFMELNSVEWTNGGCTMSRKRNKQKIRATLRIYVHIYIVKLFVTRSNNFI